MSARAGAVRVCALYVCMRARARAQQEGSVDASQIGARSPFRTEHVPDVSGRPRGQRGVPKDTVVLRRTVPHIHTGLTQAPSAWKGQVTYVVLCPLL